MIKNLCSHNIKTFQVKLKKTDCLISFLKEKLPWRSEESISRLFLKRRVFVNGKEEENPARIIKLKDEVKVKLYLGNYIHPLKQPVKVVFEDSDIIAVNKSAGVLAHPAGKINWGTLIQAVHYRYSPPPHIVNRLDKKTSGLVIFAKDLWVKQALVEEFENKKIKKYYIALTSAPFSGSVSHSFKQVSPRLVKMRRSSEGKKAKTDFKTIYKSKKLSALLCMPQTGRTHQIRAHLAFEKAPVLNDIVYGGSLVHKRYSGIFLHCYKMIFKLKNKEYDLKCPLPAVFKEIIKKNKLF